MELSSNPRSVGTRLDKDLQQYRCKRCSHSRSPQTVTLMKVACALFTARELIVAGVFGVFGGIAWLAVAATAYKHAANCPRIIMIMADVANAAERRLDLLISQIGRLLGVQWDYIPFFPSRGIEVLLDVLSIAIPILFCFSLGVLLFADTRLVRLGLSRLGSVLR